MNWSLRIAKVAGIGIYLHWTFLILLAFLAYSFFRHSDTTGEALASLGFVAALFFCVVLHELGHALTAKMYGVNTRDITLLPIGGVARLERIPEDPWQEFWVAIAGPAVNVAIAAGLVGVLAVMGAVDAARGSLEEMTAFRLTVVTFLANLLVLNVMLVLFNLLPAFPMDGGRVLRALLATRMSRVRATHIAASVGQAMAILFGILGLLSGNWILLFIAIFVYLGAQAEAQHVEMRSVFRSAVVRDAMATRFQTLREHDDLQTAIDALLAGHQHDFPVLDDHHRLVGMLVRQDLIDAVKQSGASGAVADVMRRDCPQVSLVDPLDRAVEVMQTAGCSTTPVYHLGELVGVLTSENIGEWSMIQAALREKTERGGRVM